MPAELTFTGGDEVGKLFREFGLLQPTGPGADSTSSIDSNELHNDVIVAMIHRAAEPITEYVVQNTPVDTGELRDSVFQRASDFERNTVYIGWAWDRESDVPFVKLIATEYGTVHRRGSATLRRAWANEGGDAFIARFADLLEDRLGYQIDRSQINVRINEPTRGGRPLGARDRRPRRRRGSTRG